MLSKLTPHMLTKERLDDWLSNVNVNVNMNTKPTGLKSNNIQKTTPKIKNNIVITQKDKLFWSFYIIVCGVDGYNEIQSKIFTTENDFKYESITKIREKDKMLKSVKLKIQDVESELISNKKITMNVLHALAIAYEKSIVFIHDRIYYEFPYGETYFLIERKKNDLILHLNDQYANILQIKKDLYHINNTNKKIKGIDSFTAKEVQEIAVKLQIETVSETGKPLTKTNLYNAIVIKIEKLT